MLTSGVDSTRLWDLEVGLQIGDAFEPAFAWIAPDGRSLASVPPGGGPVTIWNIEPDVWEQQACLAAGRNLTRNEWETYLPTEPYRSTCERWPLAPEAETDGSE